MKTFAVLSLLAVAFAVSSCGNSTNRNTTTTTASGNWEALLTGGTGAASQLNFVAAFTVTDTTGVANEPLDITGFSFFNSGACFATGAGTSTETGSATLSATSTGTVSGTMAFTVTSVTPAGNVLTLNGTNVTGTSSGTVGTTGTLSNGVVTGTWTLAGGDTSCTGTGSFIMCQNAATCSTTGT